MSIGERLKEIRKNEGMTQPEMAALLAVPLGTLRNWEQGIREPQGTALTKIAEHWPQYALWLLTGHNGTTQTDPVTEQVRKDSARDGTHGA